VIAPLLQQFCADLRQVDGLPPFLHSNASIISYSRLFSAIWSVQSQVARSQRNLHIIDANGTEILQGPLTSLEAHGMELRERLREATRSPSSSLSLSLVLSLLQREVEPELFLVLRRALVD
jgi:hypothetical protein